MLLPLALLTLALAADTSAAPKGSWKYLRFDYFTYICNTGLTLNNAIATECPATLMEPEYSEYTKCLCGSELYLLSMLNCATDIVQNHDYERSAIADTYEGFAETCKEYGAETALTYHEAWEKLQSTTVLSFEEANSTMEGPFEADWTMIDDALIESGYETHYQRWISELGGMITMWYLMGIMLLQTIMHWSAYIIPGFVRLISNNAVSRQLRRHIVLPAMFGKSRANPVKFMRYFLLCFPPRLHAVFFTGYLFICIFLMCFHYHEILSPSWYPLKSEFIGGSIAYRSGQLAMYKMPLVFLFAGRNNILIWLTGWQMEIFNHWHRWIARLLTIDIIMHAIGYTIYFVVGGYYAESVKESYFIWGIVGLILFCLLCLNGTKTFRQMAYECFLYLHIVMAVMSVVGTYWHIKEFKGFLNVYPVIAFWAFDRAARLVRVLLSGPFAKAHVVAHPHGVLEVDVSYSGFWKPRAGTYVFIHFLNSPLYSFQSHPFTIVDGDKKGEFKLYCKVLNGVTRQLQAKALKNGGSCDTRVLVEGPYGVEFATKLYKEVVLFAGGVGITAVYSHLKHVHALKNAGQVIHVHWAVSNSDPLTWFRKEIDYMASLANVNITIHVNDMVPAEVEDKKDTVSDTVSISNVSIHKVNFVPDFDQLISEHCVNSQGAIVFFVCGPAPMSDAIRAGVAHNLLKTKNYVQYYEESFSM